MNLEMKNQEIMNKEQRLNKYLSLCGVGSRRKCDEYISQGLISVNGKVSREMGMKVSNEDEVLYIGKKVVPQKIVYLVLNKPLEVVTTMSDPEERPTVAQYFHDLPFVKPVGRLDYNTSGVLLFTNDGEMHYRLTHPKFQVAKLYKAMIRGMVDENIFQKMKRGIRLDDGKIGHGKVKSIKKIGRNTEILLELREGINREIRRMFESLNYRLISLERIEFVGIRSNGLNQGEWRYLSKEEILLLKKY